MDFSGLFFIFLVYSKINADTSAYTATKNISLSHTPLDTETPATCDASPTEKGLVIAAENPKHAASIQTPTNRKYFPIKNTAHTGIKPVWTVIYRNIHFGSRMEIRWAWQYKSENSSPSAYCKSQLPPRTQKRWHTQQNRSRSSDS